MSRTKYILGSLVGAVTIHLAFIACSTVTTPRDAGPDGQVPDVVAMMDVAQDVGDGASVFDAIEDAVRDAEVSEASADAGVPTCQCAAPATSTFTLTFDRGNGPETPRMDYSTAIAASTPTLVGGTQAALSLTVILSFYLSDGSFVSLGCLLPTRIDGTVLTPPGQTAPSGCNVGLTVYGGDAGVAGYSGPATVQSVTFNSVTDTQLDMTFPTLTARPTGHAPITISGMRVSMTNPGATFVTPPTAYHP